MAPEHILDHLKRRLPDFEASGAPERCSSHPATEVWRVPGKPASVIVKAPEREDEGAGFLPIMVQARILKVLSPGGALAHVSSPEARPPYLIDFDAERFIVVEEDVGPYPDLGTWLEEGQPVDQLGHRLGWFIGRLHATSRGRDDLFNVLSVHPTRLRNGMLPVDRLAAFCMQAGLEAGDVLARIESTVRRLSPHGRSLVIGHAGPSSILVTPEGLRLVDWFAAHFGSPAEDVGYLTAHLWMRIHRAPTVHAAVQASIVLRDFIVSYAEALDALPGAGYEESDVADCAVHFGAALLAGAMGGMPDASLYEDLAPDSPIVQEAAAIALRHIRLPEDVDMFALLRPSY